MPLAWEIGVLASASAVPMKSRPGLRLVANVKMASVQVVNMKSHLFTQCVLRSSIAASLRHFASESLEEVVSEPMSKQA